MKISFAITGNLNFINISANINHIQIIIVSTPIFLWTWNILRPVLDRSMHRKKSTFENTNERHLANKIVNHSFLYFVCWFMS
jgi:hypothetical protein